MHAHTHTHRYEKLSGEDLGENGYVKKWEVLRGISGDGTVRTVPHAAIYGCHPWAG